MRVWINGRAVAPAKAKVSVLDHALLYGDSCFETLKSYHGKVFALKAHLDRLERSARHLHMPLPVTRHTLAQWMIRAAKSFPEQNARIRIMVTRGQGPISLDLSSCSKSIVLVIAEPLLESYERGQTRGISTIISTVRKPHAATLDPQIKSGNYLTGVLALHEGSLAGVPEVILLNLQGYVAEGSTSNVFMIKNRVLITPALHSGILDGITRHIVLKIAPTVGLKTLERLVKPKELFKADEVFFTGTVREIVPVLRINQKPIHNRSGQHFVPALHHAFKTCVEKEIRRARMLY